MEKLHRLEKAIEYLKSRGYLHTQKDISFTINADKNTVSQALKGSLNYLTDNFLKRFSDGYPIINPDWLLTGEGSMLKEIEIGGNTVDPIFQKTNGNPYNFVPVYNFDAVGSMDKANDITDAPAYIERYVPFLGARKDDICIHVTGNSMTPTHCPGSLLLVREVRDWQEYFGYGHCYVLFLRDGRRILKEVRRFAENPKEYVLCVSHNREYPEEELPKSIITAVYKVIMTYTNEGF